MVNYPQGVLTEIKNSSTIYFLLWILPKIFWGIFFFLTPNKNKMSYQDFNEPIEELKHYLQLQIEAYHKEDMRTYDTLEEKIIKVEKKL